MLRNDNAIRAMNWRCLDGEGEDEGGGEEGEEHGHGQPHPANDAESEP